MDNDAGAARQALLGCPARAVRAEDAATVCRGGHAAVRALSRLTLEVNAGTRSILASSAVLAALAVTGCGGPSGPAEPAHPPRCSPLLFLGVRGSGESPTQLLAMGTTVYAIFARLRRDDARLAGYGWPYQGARPDPAQLMRAAGALSRFLRARARQCPAERVVLAGYSAGALVVGDALQAAPPRALAAERIAAAVLLADPEFNPADVHTAAGTFDRRYGGSPRRPAFPKPLASRIRSYCRRHDIVCQRHDPAASKYQHGNYQPQQTCQATSFLEVTLSYLGYFRPTTEAGSASYGPARIVTGPPPRARREALDLIAHLRRRAAAIGSGPERVVLRSPAAKSWLYNQSSTESAIWRSGADDPITLRHQRWPEHTQQLARRLTRRWWIGFPS